MKSLVKILFAITLCLPFTLSAQQWSGNANITSPISRTGQVDVDNMMTVKRLHITTNVVGNNPDISLSAQAMIETESNMFLNIDSDNNSDNASFTIGKDSPTTTGYKPLFRVRESGNVGIGRTNPLQKLDVAGNIKIGSGGDAFLENTGGYIGVRPADATHGFIIRDHTGETTKWSGIRHVKSTNIDRLEFAVHNANSYGKSLVVTQNERVGIGIKYPQHKLHVTETARINNVFIGGNPDGGGFIDGIAGLESLHLNAAKSGNVGGNIIFQSEDTTRMMLNHHGQLLINTRLKINDPDYKLGVNGKIISEGLTIKLKAQWPDYVFGENYDLMSLENVEAHIQDNKHLPGVPSAKEVAEKGLDIETMQVKMMEKIEELTLYIIKQDKQIKTQQTQINELMKDK